MLRDKLSSLESLASTREKELAALRAPLSALSPNARAATSRDKGGDKKANEAAQTARQPRRSAVETDEIALARCIELERRKANEMEGLLADYRKLRSKSKQKVWPSDSQLVVRVEAELSDDAC